MSKKKSPPSIEDVFDFIVQIESDFNLLNWKIGSEPAWQIFRHGFCQSMFRVTGALESSKERINKETLSRGQKIRTIFNVLREILKNQVGSKSSQRKVGVFPFYRRNRDNIDVHSHDLISQLGSRAFVFGVGEGDKKVAEIIHREALNSIFSKLFSTGAERWISKNVSDKDLALYKKVVQAFEKKFDVKIEGIWEQLPIKRLHGYLTQAKGYAYLFRLLSFSSVFVVSAIQQGIIGGARRAGIPLIELQHGSISKFHPMFNWPKNADIYAVPDEFWAWGERWVEGVGFAQKTTPVIVGAGEVYESIRSSGNLEEPGLVSFMSSADVTEKLFSCALDCAVKNPDLKFIYKAHPREKLDGQIAVLKATPTIGNLTILQKEYSALETINRSEFVVGVNSATLFEAAGMGKKVAVIKISGWELAEKLIDSKGATALSPRSVATKLKMIPKAKNPYFFYAKKTAIDLSDY